MRLGSVGGNFLNKALAELSLYTLEDLIWRGKKKNHTNGEDTKLKTRAY